MPAMEAGTPARWGKTGLTEKEITLDIALRLRRLFSRVGVYVVMTREKRIRIMGIRATSPAVPGRAGIWPTGPGSPTQAGPISC